MIENKTRKGTAVLLAALIFLLALSMIAYGTVEDSASRYYKVEGNLDDETGNQNGVLAGIESYDSNNCIDGSCLYNHERSFMAIDLGTVANCGVNSNADWSINLWINLNNTRGNHTTYPASLFWSATRSEVGINTQSDNVCGTSGELDWYSNTGGRTCGPVLETGKWYMITIVYVSGDKNYLYLNGTNVANNSNAGPENWNTGHGCGFGFNANSNVYYQNGSMDEMSMYNIALTQANITELYEEFYTPPPTPPTFSVSLSYPDDNTIINTYTDETDFTFTSISDYGAVDQCLLYTNESGNWEPRGSLSPVENNTAQNITALNGSVSADIDVLWNVECLMPGGRNVTATANRTVTIDHTAPTITVIDFGNQYLTTNDSIIVNNQNLTGKWVLSDPNLYAYEFNIDNQLIQNETNMDIEDYYLNITLNINKELYDLSVGRHTYNITGWDGHTDKKIDKIKNDKKDKKDIEFDKGGKWGMRSLSKNPDAELFTYKELDRYTFEFITTDTGKRDETFVYYSDYPITLVSRSSDKYDAWMVIDELGVWIDSNTDSEYDSLKLKKISDYEYEVTLKGVTDSTIIFHSTGLLNRNELIGYFWIINITESHKFHELELATYNPTLNLTVGDGLFDANCTFDFNGSLKTISKTDNSADYYFSSSFLLDQIEGTTIRNISNSVIWNCNFTGGYNFSHVSNMTAYNLLLGDCDTYPTQTLNFSTINFANGLQVEGNISYVIDYWVLGYPQYQSNYSDTATGNGSVCIYPAFASAQTDSLFTWDYQSVNYEYNTKNATLNNATQTLNLYVNDGTDRIILTVKDTIDLAIENVSINILQYDIGDNSYKTVETLYTNTDGQALANLILYTTWYKFIVSYEGVTYISTAATKIFSTEKSFILDLGAGDWFDNRNIEINVDTSLTFNNATNNFVYSWNDPTNRMQSACLTVVKRSTAGETLINNSCTESAAGSIIVNVVNSSGSHYFATGYLLLDGDHYVTDILDHLFPGERALYTKEGGRSLGIFLSFGLMLSLAFMGIWHPAIALMLTFIAFFGSYLLGFVDIAFTWVIGLIVLGGMILFKMRQKK